MEEKIRLDRGENKHEARKASQKIGLVKKGRYFATRGFYILLTGHEFSHFYREHHKVRSNKEAQRNEKETKEFLKKMNEMVTSTNFSTLRTITSIYNF